MIRDAGGVCTFAELIPTMPAFMIKKFALIGFPLTLEIEAVYDEGLSSEVSVETVPFWRQLHFKTI
jgi:hypothetical protein